MQLKGQRVVIIGGSSGIGLEIAHLAKLEGANVTVTGRSEEKLYKVKSKLGEIKTAIADVTNVEQLEQVFVACDRIDHLVILGASLASGTILNTPLEELGRPINERLWGVIHTLRYALPKMVDGSITLTSGLFASRPVAGMAVVAAAVGGIEAMTRGLALELAPIRVNAIAPGYIDTPLLKAAFEDQYEQVVTTQATLLPTQRIGTAEETAKAIFFLMTSEFITGESLHIDGGGRLI